MDVNQPKITVLMPAYNAEKFIAEAINSVLKQSFSDFELLIINDGSTDNTGRIIRSFKDQRITLIEQENKGVAAALNTGLKLSKARYVARFDADDICYPERLKIQFDFITAHPEYHVVGSAADYVDEDGNFIFTQHPVAHLDEEIQELKYNVCPFIHSTVLYKKEVINNNGGYNEYAYTYEDHFLWVNILKDQKACNLSQPLIKVRLNPGSVTIDEKWRTRKFREIKYGTLKTGTITAAEGTELQEISERQYVPRIKEGAYYALCCKKYLVNNYQPEKARWHILKAIGINPLRADNYLLLAISYLPQKYITRLYRLNLKGI